MSVSLVSPQNGAVVSETIGLTVNTSSDTEIAGVLFELDGSWLGEVVNAPFKLIWDSSTVAEGMHSLTAIARDAAGNEASTPTVLIEVQNAYNAAPEITSVFPPGGSGDVSIDQPINITFSEAMDAMTINETTIGLLSAADVQVAGNVTYNSATHTVALMPANLLESNTTYQVVVQGGAGGVTDIAGKPMATDHNWFFTTRANTNPDFRSFWDDATTPTVLAVSDTNAVELGMKFRSDADGVITALRFYKSVSNTGTHTGKLWTANGTLLASVTFTNETGSGWQEMPLPTPVAIRANTTYVVSYHTQMGRYSVDIDYFTGSGYDKSPLRALASGEDGSNGVYLYGTGGFPDQTWNATNYWVDVVFQSNLVQANNIPVFLSFWDDATIPTVLAASDTNAVELGMKFRSDVDGVITALRFYKSVSNTGTHTGNLWTANGTLLASVTFTKETASGWQEMPLPTPVAIRANTTYVVSYHTQMGRYAADTDYFTGSGYEKSPLRALASGEEGSNGVYLYGTGGFPNQSWNATNYWVDVVFEVQ